MKRVMLGLLSGAVLLTAASAGAASFGVEMDCPKVKPAGGPLWCKVTITNNDCFRDFVADRLYAGLVGNQDQTLGGVGVWGPYNRTISAELPPATCAPPQWPPAPPLPTSTTVNVKIIDDVPLALSGVVVGAFVIFPQYGGQSVKPHPLFFPMQIQTSQGIDIHS